VTQVTGRSGGTDVTEAIERAALHTRLCYSVSFHRVLWFITLTPRDSLAIHHGGVVYVLYALMPTSGATDWLGGGSQIWVTPKP
jgi:hypothetical protein